MPPPIDFLMLASELVDKEETMRHELIESKAYVLAERAAEGVDTALFSQHSSLRYVAGFALGLFIREL